MLEQTLPRCTYIHFFRQARYTKSSNRSQISGTKKHSYSDADTSSLRVEINETVDDLAKDDTPFRFIGPELFCGLTESYIRNHL